MCKVFNQLLEKMSAEDAEAILKNAEDEFLGAVFSGDPIDRAEFMKIHLGLPVDLYEAFVERFLPY